MRSRARSGWALLPALALAVSGCVGCATGVSGTAGAVPVPVLSTAQATTQALLNLAEAGVLHYTGSLVAAGGRTVGLDVRVTSAGEGLGTITVDNQQGSLVLVDNTLYIDAPAQFWSLLAGDPGSRAQAVDSRWVKVSNAVLGINLGAILAPGAIGASLAKQVDSTAGGTLASQPASDLDGTSAAKVDLADGTVYLARADPHGVLQFDVPADLGSARNVTLNVTDSSATESTVYQGLLAQAQQLGTAVDTNVDIQQGDQSWGSCTAAGCAVVVTFTNASSMPASVVVHGNWTGDNQPAGSCQIVVGPVAAGQSATATCTDTDPLWSAFFNHAHATPGQHPYEVDWTAEALAAPPNLTALTGEAAAAAKAPAADAGTTTGSAYVYLINYQDQHSHPQVWKYGVTEQASWPAYVGPELTACRAASQTSCSASLVTATTSRTAADALVAQLVATARGTLGHCPPGQWVDCD